MKEAPKAVQIDLRHDARLKWDPFAAGGKYARCCRANLLHMNNESVRKCVYIVAAQQPYSAAFPNINKLCMGEIM